MTLAAALMATAPMATGQQSTPQSRIAAGIEEAVKGLDNVPSLKKLSPEKKKALVEFTLGNTMFVMAHEMGHIVVSELGLPVLGKEEDAADSFAALTALRIRSAFSERVLVEAAKGWVLSAYRDKSQGNELAFYDEHGLDLQRAYFVVCLMVGSDPEKFKALAKEAKLPEERQTSCVRDYKNAVWSWELALKPHLRAADQPKIAINVSYKDDEKYALQAKVLRDMGLLEAFAAHAADRFAWKQPFSMEARGCGEPNATWNAGTRTMTLCYELAAEFVELYQGYSKKFKRKYQAAK
jgi:hypothetical protein